MAAGHEVACHFAEQVDGSAEQLQATGRAQPSTPAAGGPATASATADEGPTGAIPGPVAHVVADAQAPGAG